MPEFINVITAITKAGNKILLLYKDKVAPTEKASMLVAIPTIKSDKKVKHKLILLLHSNASFINLIPKRMKIKNTMNFAYGTKYVLTIQVK